jgi:PAS domain S-box-containing protein
MKPKILEYIDFEKVNILLEGFNQSTGFVTAILDLDGNVLSKSGWRQICTEFHRVNPETSKKCTISDIVLAGQLGKGEKYHFYKCLNGLVDVAVPIIIKGEHIANLFSGQFFFEKPDNAFFQKQATKFGFNESVYLKALGDVPIISEEKAKVTMEFLLNMTHIISDMTLQKLQLMELNDALRESEETYRMLFDSIDDAILASELLANGTLGNFFIVNDVACQRLGYLREELLTKTPSDINSASTRLSLPSRIQKLLEEKHLILETEHVTKEGKIIPVEMSTNVSRINKKTVIFSVARDITKRKESEKEILRNRQVLQLFIENVPASIAMFDCEMKYLAYSQRYLTDYDLGERELTGHSHYDIFPEIPERWKEIYRRCIAGAIEVCDEDTFPQEGGKTDWVRWAIHPWYESDEKIGGIILFSEVITERKEAALFIQEKTDEIEAQNEEYQQINEELNQINQELLLTKEKAEESGRLKTAFLQNMSHELRTPMNAIMGFSDLLDSNFDNKEKLKSFSKIIRQRCSDLLEIINDILDISKIESGQLPVNVDEFYLSELFADLSSFFAEYQKRMGKEHILFHLQASCNHSQNLIVTDKVKLKQIFINLITNAFKFTDVGKIEGGCKIDKNNNLVFYVSDTGIGIPRNKQEAVFDRFTQLNDGLKKNIGGTGLGLPIVKGLIGLLGGEITLESEPNIGSTFTFTFPFKATTLVHLQSLQLEKLNSEILFHKTILIVEDDLFNAEYINEILSDRSLYILQAENGKKAIEISISQPLDLVLMDIRLPDMNGYEAVRQIRQYKPQLKIIAQTAYAAQDEKQKAIDIGCIDYISKPIKQEMLLTMICKHLSNQ